MGEIRADRDMDFRAPAAPAISYRSPGSEAGLPSPDDRFESSQGKRIVIASRVDQNIFMCRSVNVIPPIPPR